MHTDIIGNTKAFTDSAGILQPKSWMQWFFFFLLSWLWWFLIHRDRWMSNLIFTLDLEGITITFLSWVNQFLIQMQLRSIHDLYSSKPFEGLSQAPYGSKWFPESIWEIPSKPEGYICWRPSSSLATNVYNKPDLDGITSELPRCKQLILVGSLIDWGSLGVW